MKVNVIVSTEYEIEIDDKFKVPECDDEWDKIPPAQELIAAAQQQILTGIDPVSEPDISKIYDPDGEVLYCVGARG